jgi:hypothetical protein
MFGRLNVKMGFKTALMGVALMLSGAQAMTIE